MVKILFQAIYLEIKPLKTIWPHEGKTLKLQLLKKLSIEFYETQDLISPNGEPKLLFYGYSCQIFFLHPITEGNCDSVLGC